MPMQGNGCTLAASVKEGIFQETTGHLMLLACRPMDIASGPATQSLILSTFQAVAQWGSPPAHL